MAPTASGLIFHTRKKSISMAEQLVVLRVVTHDHDQQVKVAERASRPETADYPRSSCSMVTLGVSARWGSPFSPKGCPGHPCVGSGQ